MKCAPYYPTPNSPLPTPHSQLPTPNSPLPTPHSQLPIPNSPLPTPHSQLPTQLRPIKRVAKFCSRVGESARALRIAAIKKA